MPRAKPFPDSEEEEKTTVESQWEEEASTTVEQGDVADKIRALGVEPRQNGTNVTNTSAGALDEPTVDEAHMSAITPVRDMARLQITQGNDAGQEIEIRPGKTYTIGRAIDNDVVLTDIAVSRKHFDVRFEDGAWVIVDRGSGNGTVVNGNLEDNPFMLANGDVIEIGNTEFRFEQPNAAPRPQRTMELDDEELSTVAGKPLRHEIVEAAEPMLVAAPRPARAKTLPPPTPLRAHNASQPPPLGFPPLGPQPAAAVSMPQMASRAPLATPAAPSQPAMLGADLGMPQSPMAAPMQPPSASQQRQAYGYPQATEIPPHSVHAQMLLIQTQNRRGDGSTLHVPPTPYDGLPASPRYLQPQLSKRTKLVLAGVGLAVFAAVMTIAIVKSGKATAPSAAATEKTPATPGQAKAAKADTQPSAPVATVHAEPIKETAPANATETAKDTKTTPAEKTDEPVVAVKAEAVEDSGEPAKQAVAKTEPRRTEPKRTEPKRTEPKRTEQRHSEPKRTERREARRDTPVAPKRVAASIDPETAKNQADSLYRAKKFSEASAYLASAAKKVDEGDARELRRTADMYAKLGRALAAGTAPATRSTDAFEALRKAQNYDRNVGNAFDDEIQNKLAQVAPKAAFSYVAARDYPSARTALVVAQKYGSSEGMKIVAQKLESAASDLYNDGMRELKSDPSAAKDKFRQIKSIVDSKSIWYQRAQKQLQGS